MRDPATPIFTFAFAVFVAFVAFVVGLNVSWRSPPTLEQWANSQGLELREETGIRVKDLGYTIPGFRDEDRDCQDTHTEILIKTSIEKVGFKKNGKGNCVVESGYWIDAYSGIHYDKASDLHIDHRVSKAEAMRSGGAAWDRETWKAFVNDAANLTPTLGTLDISKGARGPSKWVPERDKADYARKWIQTKRKWGLSIDRAERQALRDLLGR